MVRDKALPDWVEVFSFRLLSLTAGASSWDWPDSDDESLSWILWPKCFISWPFPDKKPYMCRIAEYVIVCHMESRQHANTPGFRNKYQLTWFDLDMGWTGWSSTSRKSLGITRWYHLAPSSILLLVFREIWWMTPALTFMASCQHLNQPNWQWNAKDMCIDGNFLLLWSVFIHWNMLMHSDLKCYRRYTLEQKGQTHRHMSEPKKITEQ